MTRFDNRIPRDRTAARIVARVAAGRASGDKTPAICRGKCLMNIAAMCAVAQAIGAHSTWRRRRCARGKAGIPSDQHRTLAHSSVCQDRHAETGVVENAPADQSGHEARSRRRRETCRYQTSRAAQFALAKPPSKTINVWPADLHVHAAHAEGMRNRHNFVLGRQHDGGSPDRLCKTEYFPISEAFGEHEPSIPVDSRFGYRFVE